ncbi:putative transcription factor interactor and regulator CCHC(Zn) family [Helianthus annuus]|nr:putative transcription factor interactor and regulator CCHC(Zn) family [Helianthus annuus]
MGLDDNFSVIKTQILAMKPTSSMGAAYHLIAEDEHQRNIAVGRKGNGADTTAFQASHMTTRTTQIQRKSSAQKTERPGEKTAHCTFCGKDGHIAEGCFKKIVYPDWWPGKGKRESSKPRAAMAETNHVPGLTNEQYEAFLKLFGKQNDQKRDADVPIANMAGLEHGELDWNK